MAQVNRNTTVYDAISATTALIARRKGTELVSALSRPLPQIDLRAESSPVPFLQPKRDALNVGYDVYRIETKVTSAGATLDKEHDDLVPHRDRRTRKTLFRELDDDLTYTANQLDLDLVNRDQLRLVIRTFRDRLFTESGPPFLRPHSDLSPLNSPLNMIASTDGSSNRRIPFDVRVRWRRWSPDGRFIAFVASQPDEETADLLLFDVVTESLRPLLTDELPKWAPCCAWRVGTSAE